MTDLNYTDLNVSYCFLSGEGLQHKIDNTVQYMALFPVVAGLGSSNCHAVSESVRTRSIDCLSWKLKLAALSTTRLDTVGGSRQKAHCKYLGPVQAPTCLGMSVASFSQPINNC